MGYARSPFRDFESYLRIVVVLDEDDIQLILKQNKSKFISYERTPGIYQIKDISEVVYKLGYQEETLQIEYDNMSMKTNFFNRFGLTFGTLRFDEKYFCEALSGFKPYWDYKPTNTVHVDSSGVVNTSEKVLNLSTRSKIRFKSDVNDGSLINGIQKPILFSFIIFKPPGHKVKMFLTILLKKKRNKSVLKTITFY